MCKVDKFFLWGQEVLSRMMFSFLLPKTISPWLILPLWKCRSLLPPLYLGHVPDLPFLRLTELPSVVRAETAPLPLPLAGGSCILASVPQRRTAEGTKDPCSLASDTIIYGETMVPSKRERTSFIEASTSVVPKAVTYPQQYSALEKVFRCYLEGRKPQEEYQRTRGWASTDLGEDEKQEQMLV